MYKMGQTKKVPFTLSNDLLRVALAIVFLALTAIDILPMPVKIVFALLSISLLVFHRCKPENLSDLQIGMICFAVAIGVIGVCSKSSFLYPLNDWEDANCFFTVGKGMMNGIVVYRDILEQKGPFLYFVHGLAWLISNDTFIGVYFLEVLAATFFLFYIRRAIALFVQLDCSILAIPICAVMIFTCESFGAGDSVEELSLPFLAYAMWVGMDAICNKRDISKREFFIVGLTSGLIFWSKVTVVGLYLGWYLYFAVGYIRNKKWAMLIQSILVIACGVAAATIPFIVYFGVHGAISDWLTVYLYNNLFLYSPAGEQPFSIIQIVKNVLGGTYNTVIYNPLIPIMSVIAVVYLALHKMEAALFLVSTATFLLLFAFMGGVYHVYYSFSINLFLPLGAIPLLRAVSSKRGHKYPAVLEKYILPIILAVCIPVAGWLTSNGYLMGVSKEELPQYKFASIIGKDGSASLLNYGFLDGGFHTVTNTLPTCKAFCLLCITPDLLMDMQDQCVEDGACDYVVTRGQKLTHRNYTCISSYEYPWNGNNVVYYLYQRT